MLIEHMRAISPLEKLSSGFAHVADSDGNTIKSVKAVNTKDKLKLTFKDGTILAEVTGINE